MTAHPFFPAPALKNESSVFCLAPLSDPPAPARRVKSINSHTIRINSHMIQIDSHMIRRYSHIIHMDSHIIRRYRSDETLDMRAHLTAAEKETLRVVYGASHRAGQLGENGSQSQDSTGLV